MKLTALNIYIRKKFKNNELVCDSKPNKFFHKVTLNETQEGKGDDETWIDETGKKEQRDV